MDKKICAKFGIEKLFSEYHLRKKNGRISTRLECKDCYRKKSRERYGNNRDIIILRNKEYAEKNKEKVVAKRNQWVSENKDWIKKRRHEKYLSNADIVKKNRKEYYYRNKESCIRSVNDYVERNKSKVRARQRANHRKRKDSDIGYSILKILRT